MVFEVPRGKLLRNTSYGPTDSRDRDWQFRNSRLHDGLMQRIEGFGSTLDFSRFGNMPTTSQMRPGAPLANTDMYSIQIKNRYNAKSQPWLQAYDPVPETWDVNAVDSSQPFLPGRANGTFANNFKTLYSSATDPSYAGDTQVCPCAVQPEWPTIPKMSYAQNPPTCGGYDGDDPPDVFMPIQDGMQIERMDNDPSPSPSASASASAARAARDSARLAARARQASVSGCSAPSAPPPQQQQRRPHHAKAPHTLQPPPRLYTPFSGGHGPASNAVSADSASAAASRPVKLTFILPVWGLCVAGVLAGLLLVFAIYGAVKAVSS